MILNWNSITHQYITGKAISKCSSRFKSIVNLLKEILVLGIEAPDRIFKDFTYHYYNYTANEYGRHNGKIIDKISAEIELINEMFNNPNLLIHHPGIDEYLKDFLDTSLKSIIFELGCLSHYVADLHQPIHTDGKETSASQVAWNIANCFLEFENKISRFKPQLNDQKLLSKIDHKISFRNNYSLLSSPSGTLSIRRSDART